MLSTVWQRIRAWKDPLTDGPVLPQVPSPDLSSSELSEEREPDAPDRPPLEAACFAAHSAPYLRPDGLVQACCASGFLLGRVSDPKRQSLREI